MADEEKKGQGKREKAATADQAENEPRSATAEAPIARPQAGRRWLTSAELETLRSRLQKRFH